MMRAVESGQVVTISPDYFFLRRPLERRLYEIARKHCGKKPKWQIRLEKLQLKTGSNAPIKKFRHNLREIIKSDVTPFYCFEIDAADLVTVRPRTQPATAITQDITIPAWAEEQARKIAREKGWDFYALQSEWLSFAKEQAAQGKSPESTGAAFVGYCKKKESLR